MKIFSAFPTHKINKTKKQKKPRNLDLNKTNQTLDGPAVVSVNIFVRSISKIDDVVMVSDLFKFQQNKINFF